MKLTHLAITVADQARARRFYTETLGLEGTVRDDPDGMLLTMPDRFVLALLEGEPPPERDRVHFGFALDSADKVRLLRERLLAAGVEEVEWWELDGFVSSKFLDPDGYVVEVFWERETA
jgi:catechol 2,3-dioxygenase-like lactoylglutathione lyase family enzyme